MSARRFNLLKFSFYTMMSLVAYTTQGQNDASTSIHDWYDSKVGKENLDVNNGKILLNYDKILKTTIVFIFKITLMELLFMITNFIITSY